MKATIILVPLMGFTWIIGLFAVGEEGRVFAYLFVFANVFQVREGTSLTITVFLSLDCKQSWPSRSLLPPGIFMQGLFIFVLHVVRHEKVYGKIKLPKFRKQVSTVVIKYQSTSLLAFVCNTATLLVSCQFYRKIES